MWKRIPPANVSLSSWQRESSVYQSDCNSFPSLCQTSSFLPTNKNQTMMIIHNTHKSQAQSDLWELKSEVLKKKQGSTRSESTAETMPPGPEPHDCPEAARGPWRHYSLCPLLSLLPILHCFQLFILNPVKSCYLILLSQKKKLSLKNRLSQDSAQRWNLC